MAGFLLRRVVLTLAAALFLAWVGPFGTGGLPALPRTLYWLGVMALGSLIGLAVVTGVERVGWFGDRPWARVAACTVLMAVPISAMVWAVTHLAFGAGSVQGGVGAFFLPVLVISAIMATVSELADRQPPETHAAAPGAAPPRFLERLPFRLRGAELIAVQAEDHYLRVHTDRGSELILMRLSDAVAELEGIEGAQTHRSWWVAKGAVEDVRRGDGRAALRLKGGAEAPVSRTYARALREAGWF